MIEGVAIIELDKMYKFPKPKRHHHVIKMMVKKHGFRYVAGEQGFYDENGNFLNREDARNHALECGQVETTDHDKELFSEDLW